MRQPRAIDHAFYPLQSLDTEGLRTRWAERDYELEGRYARRAVLRAALCLAILFGGMAAAGHWLNPVQQAATTRFVPG